jgi:hypothetical protein
MLGADGMMTLSNERRRLKKIEESTKFEAQHRQKFHSPPTHHKNFNFSVIKPSEEMEVSSYYC